jgi:hypothetical protein
MLGDTAAVVGLETVVQRIVPLFDDLSSDDEYVVRQHLAEQLFEIACVCAGDGKDAGGGGYRLLIEVGAPLLPLASPPLLHLIATFACFTDHSAYFESFTGG